MTEQQLIESLTPEAAGYEGKSLICQGCEWCSVSNTDYQSADMDYTNLNNLYRFVDWVISRRYLEPYYSLKWIIMSHAQRFRAAVLCEREARSEER